MDEQNGESKEEKVIGEDVSMSDKCLTLTPSKTRSTSRSAT